MQTDVPQVNQQHELFVQAAKLAIQKFRTTVNTWGPTHPRAALALHQVALLYKALEKYDQAQALFKKALSILEDNFGTGIPTYYAALNFLGGQCRVLDEHSLPHVFIEDKASLISLTIDPTDFVVNPEILPDTTPRRFVQVLITWGSRMSPEWPNLINTNILSMIFREEKLEEFSALIEKKLIKDERKFTLFGLVGILQEWKLNTGHFEGISFPAPPELTEFGKLPDTTEIITQPDAGHMENVAESSNREDQVINYTETEELLSHSGPAAPRAQQRPTRDSIKEASSPAQKGAPARAAEELASLVSKKLAGKDLMDLNDLILPKNRKRYVKKLFRGDALKFNQFIHKINQLDTWKEASGVIEDFYMQASIYPYDKIALEFSNVVYHRYFPTERGPHKTTKF